MELTYAELNLIEDLPMFGTASIPKSEIARSLERKGIVRIVGVEPFCFIVELTPEPVLSFGDIDKFDKWLQEQPQDFQFATYHNAFHEVLRDFVEDDVKFQAERVRYLYEAIKENKMIQDALDEFLKYEPVTPQPQEGGTTTGDAAGKPEMHVFYELIDGLAPIPWEVYKVEDVERSKPSLSPEMARNSVLTEALEAVENKRLECHENAINDEGNDATPNEDFAYSQAIHDAENAIKSLLCDALEGEDYEAIRIDCTITGCGM